MDQNVMKNMARDYFIKLYTDDNEAVTGSLEKGTFIPIMTDRRGTIS